MTSTGWQGSCSRNSKSSTSCTEQQQPNCWAWLRQTHQILCCSNSLKAARATQIRIKHQYLHGCKLPPNVSGSQGWTTERMLWVVLVQHILPPSWGVPTARKKTATWKINFESSPSSIMLGPRFAACTVPLVSNLFPGRASALSHTVYSHKQAARTNFTASTQLCCCFLFFGRKGFFPSSSLLPNKGHLQLMENSWKRLGPNWGKGGKEASRAALLKDFLPSQSTKAPKQQMPPSLSSHSFLSSRSSHSPRGFAAWATITAKGSFN